MINENFVILAVLLNIWGSLGYAFLTLKGRVKPNRVTFSLWALAPLVAFGAQLDKGVGLIALMTFMAGFGPLLVLIASFLNKESYWQLTRFDYICGGLSLAGLTLWALTGEGNLAIGLAIMADGLAALPTVVKSYRAPETENYFLYFLSMIGAGITILAVDQWSFAHYGFPIYIFAICAVIASLVKFRLGKKLSRIGNT